MKRLLAQVMLLADYDNVGVGDRIKYIWNAILHFAPIAIVLDLFSWWFKENHQFGTFMCIALIINLVIGAYMHKKSGTFCFKQFIVKNVELAFIITITYLMLEMLRYTAGDNLAGEIFKVLIQVMTLLYPTSKVLKNIFIISKGKYPPEFIMRKLYNFEKNGDLEKLFSTTKVDNDELDLEFEKYKLDLKKQEIKQKEKEIKKEKETIDG